MKKLIFIFFLLSYSFVNAQNFEDLIIESSITEVQPMTGIVFWDGDNTNTDAISLEYSYMLYDDVVDLDGNIIWDAMETKLNDIASRNHQAIFRFRYTYVGELTSVPQYIKNLSDYTETKGKSEGEDTWFPDWSHPELQSFHLRFYKAFAEKYDGDPRLAFMQTGYGLWAEYHIYDGPFTLGGTFPSMDFQTQFFYHLDSLFNITPWCISVDAADGKYAPFEENEPLLNLKFGNFDDSFLAKEHPQVNFYNWKFFDVNDRYKYSPAGGEFSYYTDYDQEHVLDLPNGPHGISFEESAKQYKISYMIGNDQPGYQTMDRIKEASLATGYKFQVESYKISNDSSIVVIKNIGIAPFYYPAFVTVNGVRSTTSLQYLKAGESIQCGIAQGTNNSTDDPVLTIESDYILEGQTIGYYGTTYNATTTLKKNKLAIEINPNILYPSNTLFLQKSNTTDLQLVVLNMNGEIIARKIIGKEETQLELSFLNKGMYLLQFQSKDALAVKKIIVIE